ncbi:ATP-binding protein [Streptomyces fumanus]|uniref:ATP-binding protein n=1 Tax=Streptomyces fumanus TaxID=67302 RepID=UPI00167DD0CC|nr:ATP-binding protein [Streptomyces fumanus]
MNEQPQPLAARWSFHRRDRRSVRQARKFARAALGDWRVGPRTDDVLLCVSELATNAVLHGVPPGRGFGLRLVLHPGGTLRIEVHDSGGGPETVRVPEAEAAAESEHGRGLLLVSAVADKWGVDGRRPGKTVWAEFDVGARPGGR